MIESALDRLGKKICTECRKINSKDNKYCKKCDSLLDKTETSTPEDGL